MRNLLTLFRPAIIQPNQIANLTGWWDATDISTITQSGSRVSQLSDKSGLGNHLTAASSQQPLFVASGINGRSTLQYGDSGNTRCLSIADNTSLKYSELTYFAVCQRSAAGAAAEWITGKWGFVNKRESVININNSTNILSFSATTDGTGAGGIAINSSQTVSLNTPFVARATYANSDKAMSLSLSNQTAATGTLGGNVFNSSAFFMIGGFNQDGSVFSNPFQGYISEVLFYTRRLTAAEIAKVNAYLSAKYAIAL
jgi:hypothetical protein